MSEELRPSAQELRQEHTKQAEAVKALGELASGEHVTNELLWDSEAGEDYSVNVPTEVPEEAKPYLKAAATSAQEDLNKGDAKAGKIVTQNLDKFKAEAEADRETQLNRQKAA